MAKAAKSSMKVYTFVHWFGGNGVYGADTYPHRTLSGAHAHLRKTVRERWEFVTGGKPFPGLKKAMAFLNEEDETFEVQLAPLGD